MELSPEMLEQLVQMGSADDQNSILQQQIVQAQALRKPSGVQHTTGMGAAFGALGDIGNNLIGGLQERSLRKDQQANIGQQNAAMKQVIQLLRNKTPGGAAPGLPPPGAPPMPIGPGDFPGAGAAGGTPDPFGLGAGRLA